MIGALLFSLFAILFPDLRDSSLTTAIYIKLQKEVDATIEDRQQRKELQDLFDDLKDLAQDNHRARKELVKEFWRVDQNYDATLEEYVSIISSLDSMARAHEVELLNARDSLKSHLTQKEWEEGYADLERYLRKSLRRVKKDKNLN